MKKIFDNFNFGDLGTLEPSDEIHSPLNINDVKNNLPNYNSEKLCEIIACDRYLGSYKEIAILCMEELSNRRIKGDSYNFEDFIEKSYKELPKLEFSIPDLGDLLRDMIARKIK